jgi:Reverse transcriptase (RNA-dependent DNA polymerase)
VDTVFLTKGTDEDLPLNYDEAISGKEGDKWKQAMDEEMENLKTMGTWVRTNLPKERTVVGCKWVYLRKRDEYGTITKYKARLVAQGFSQKPGTDYSDNGTFAPVMRFETLRTMLAHSAINNWKLRQFDIKGAYLHGELKEEIFMAQAPGYNDGTGQVYLLKRALYGLKQAGNVWNTKLNNVLIGLGYTQLKSDYCCYSRSNGNDTAILLIWVDDFISIASNENLNDRIEKELRSHFEVKSLGQPSLIIGVKIRQGDHIVKLSQTHYIDKLLSKYGLQDANPLSTPMDTTIKLDDHEEAPEEEKTSSLSKFGYANLIGSLMYLAIATRPDIAYSVNKLAQYTSAPKPKHWTAIKRIFRYLKGTKYSELVYGGTPELLNDRINFYCDADWASDLDRKSISGYVVTIAGGAVAWSSKKQSTVAPSTPEAEYIAAAHVAKQVLWHRSLLKELKFPLSTPSTIFSDNQSAISIAHHPEFHARTKHIDIAFHFLRDHVQKGTIDLSYINTDFNIADIFTKPLRKPTHENFTYELGVISDQGGVLK